MIWLFKSYIKFNVYIVIGFYHRSQIYKVVLYIAIYCSVVINYELNFNMFLINLIKHVFYEIENGSFERSLTEHRKLSKMHAKIN